VIRTVLGDIATDEVQATSMHEHLFIDLRRWYDPGEDDGRSRFEPVRLGIAPAVRSAPLAFEDNLYLSMASTATAELERFREAGGSCIVDMTCDGLGGLPELLPDVSRESQVHVVLGCGFFVHPFHPEWVCSASVDRLEEHLRRETSLGVSGSSIRPGVIGEIGMSHPPEACELRVLQAAARVGASAGFSVHIHVDPNGAEACRFVSLCAEEGLAPGRVVCGHLDVHIDLDYHVEVLSMGANLGLDTFGTDVYFEGSLYRPDDEARMDHLDRLVGLGFQDQIVLAQDVAFKCHLRAFGGNGYDHLLARVIPDLRSSHHLSPEVVDRLLIHNPRRILSIAA
jgi:phosphotriesterase-related protein